MQAGSRCLPAPILLERPRITSYNVCYTKLLRIVQSDPVFARLEEFFNPRNLPLTPIYHTGFVVPDDRARWLDGSPGADILVSAGDGRYGGVLFRTAIEAQRILWPVS